jgi:aminoglycoside phosphotransferase (APT) family kinase protein
VADGVHSGVPSVQQALLAGLRDQGLQQVAADPAGEAAAYARQALDRLCTDIADPTVDQALLAECTDLFAELDGGAVRDRDRDQHTTSAIALQRALTERLRDRGADDDDPTVWRRAAQTGARLRAAIEAGRPPQRCVPPGEQTAITAERLTEYLRTRLPGAESVNVIDLDVLAGGRSKTTMFARLSGHPGLTEIALRQDMLTGLVDSIGGATRVADEWPLLGAAFAAGLPVAEPIWLEPAETTLGPPLMITRKLAGSAPGDWRGFYEPTDRRTAAAALQLARELGRLHSLDVEALDLPGYPAAPARDRLLREIDYRWSKWQQDTLQPYPVIDCAFERLRRECQSGLGGPALVHGDVLPHNLLVEDGRLTALLDWEFAHIGDPAEDLAYCRPAVSAALPWEDFLAAYQDAGGAAVDERRLAIFGLFALVRNSSLLAGAVRLYRDGIVDFTTGALAHVSLPTMEIYLGALLEGLDAIVSV